MPLSCTRPLRIAVIGSGISGLAAAWLLSQRHDVTVFEKDARIGGHSNTVLFDAPGGPIAVDTGFIVFNQPNYPNLTALFEHLGVVTRESEMSFGVSRQGGRFEYAGSGLRSLLAQPTNVLRLRFWNMLRDLVRFYREAPSQMAGAPASLTLGQFLDRFGYNEVFRYDHLLPMAAAIWSVHVADAHNMPARAFIEFFDNHGLLRLHGRSSWHTVVGGSATYVSRLCQPLNGRVHIKTRVASIARSPTGVKLAGDRGHIGDFDHVVVATHADQALAMLQDADATEQGLLGAFRYTKNRAVLHSDPSFMPRRRAVWSSWNYVEAQSGAHISYWMNRLQGLSERVPLFVTLNPTGDPSGGIMEERYHHPVFDLPAIEAQRKLWSLQGHNNTWFCGAYFGAGFHEDGLQAGLAVAEDLGGGNRPWTVRAPSARIFRTSVASSPAVSLAS